MSMTSSKLCSVLLFALCVSVLSVIKEEMDFTDLGSPSTATSIKKAFKTEIGLMPKGVCVNDRTRGNAVYPALTMTFGRPCYKHMGDIVFKESVDVDESDVVLATGALYNFGNETATLSTQLEGTYANVAELIVSRDNTFRFLRVISVKGSFDMGLNFSLRTIARERTKETSENYFNRISASVPPKSLIRVEAVAKTKTQRLDFEAPVFVKGDFGANFPVLQSSYKWPILMPKIASGEVQFWKGKLIAFLPVEKVLPVTTGRWKGQVNGIKAVDIKVKIHPAQPLTDGMRKKAGRVARWVV